MGKLSKTTMKLSKTCKSCVLFRSENGNETVATSLYLLNKSFTDLGKPETIEVVITASK